MSPTSLLVVLINVVPCVTFAALQLLLAVQFELIGYASANSTHLGDYYHNRNARNDQHYAGIRHLPKGRLVSFSKGFTITLHILSSN